MKTIFYRIKSVLRYLKMWNLRILLRNVENHFHQNHNIAVETQAIKDLMAASYSKALSPLILSNFSKIVWVVPQASRSGGGFRTLSRFIKKFDHLGVRQELSVYHPFFEINVSVEKGIWRNDFGLSDAIAVKSHRKSDFKGAFVFATGWQTVFFVLRKFQRPQRGWFIQDHEVLFHTPGSLSTGIDEAYHYFDFAITAGPWLTEIAQKKGVRITNEFLFGADEIYFNNSLTNSNRKKQVVLYFQVEKNWRGSLLALEAVKEALASSPGWNAVLVGGDTASSIKLPRNIKNFGRMSPIGLSYLYAESSVGICISLSNASLVPIEMIASGLPVITNSGPNNEWLQLISKSNLTFVEYDLNKLKESLQLLMSEIDLGRNFEPSIVPTWHEVIDTFSNSLMQQKIAKGNVGYYSLLDFTR